MSNIDKRALREAAEKASTDKHSQDEWFHYLRCSSPATVLALLDELEAETSYREGAFIACNRWHDKFRESEAKLEAAEKRIAELSHHLQCAHGFIEHTEAFGHEASNGILCCGDAQWNIDESKSVLASAGKGGAS